MVETFPQSASTPTSTSSTEVATILDENQLPQKTQCCIVGGGPAGLIAGLLLARGGIDVVVLEKHADFLRDFRGDTVHSSTLTLLDEIGLAEEFKKLNPQYVDQISLRINDQEIPAFGIGKLPVKHPYIAMVPQWEFLNMLAAVSKKEKTYHLVMNANVTDLIVNNGRVEGVTYILAGQQRQLRADLVLACDGRNSGLRNNIGRQVFDFGVPIDVIWFRVPRYDDDPKGNVGAALEKNFCFMLNRNEYFQCAYLIRHGSFSELLAEGIEPLRAKIKKLHPWLGQRVDDISEQDLHLLNVRLDRLPKWYSDGFLCIGDSAHAMSPIGGVGINLAIQDAVAAARLLAPALQQGRPSVDDLRRVQRRRLFATWVTQSLQRFLHRLMFNKRFKDSKNKAQQPQQDQHGQPQKLPRMIRLLHLIPPLRLIPVFIFSVGILPEHAPKFARVPEKR